MVLSAVIFYQSIKENVVIVGLSDLLQFFKVHYSVTQVRICFRSWSAHETKIIVHILVHVIVGVNDWGIESSLGYGTIHSDACQ